MLRRSLWGLLALYAACSTNDAKHGAASGGAQGFAGQGGSSAGESAGSGAAAGASLAAGAAGEASGIGEGGAPQAGAAGAAGAAAMAGDAGAPSSGGTTADTLSVLRHHNHLNRDGLYVAPGLTRARAEKFVLDTSFANATLSGVVYAQPLYLVGAHGAPDELIVASEQNRVYAFAASDGTPLWTRQVGTPVATGLPCGNIANGVQTLGITGTPVIDATTRTIYLDAMTADASVVAKHMIHALDADSGAERAGFPIDVNLSAASPSSAFNSLVQNQRAALAIIGDKLFVPYGGHVGDCGGYHGFIVGVSLSDPTRVTAWSTRNVAGGIWGASGIASDGVSLFFTTGNGKALASDPPTTSPATWGDEETVYKLAPSLVQPPLSATNDYFVPNNWDGLDRADQDMGGTAPVLFDVPRATPSKLMLSLGKDGKAYLLDRSNLGGLDAAPLAWIQATAGHIINAAAAYTSASGATFVVYRNAGIGGCPAGQSGGISATKVSPGAALGSPPTLTLGWCSAPANMYSPSVSVLDADGNEPIVWSVGGDNKLYALDGDSGQVILAGVSIPTLVQPIQTPIVAAGRVFVASNGALYAFTAE